MIVVTNRTPQDQHYTNWSDIPESDGRLHWIALNSNGNVTGEIETTTHHTPPAAARKAILTDLADKKDLVSFVAGARNLDYRDFTNFQRRITTAQFSGAIVGFSPAFSTGLKSLPLAKNFEKSHAGRQSFSHFLRALDTFSADRLSLILQSGANDLCARTLNMQNATAPRFHTILSTASAVDRSAYAKNAVKTPPSQKDMMVLNATRTIDAADHFTAYYRRNDPLLLFLPAAIWFFQGPRPLGTAPPTIPYEHPGKVSFVNCRCVGPPSHKCYEKDEVIVRDIVEAIGGKTGDRKLK